MATVAPGSSPAPSTSGGPPSCAGPAGNRRRTAKDGSGGLVALGNRALGINRHLGLVVKAGDALGLGGNGLGGRIGNGLGVDRTRPQRPRPRQHLRRSRRRRPREDPCPRPRRACPAPGCAGPRPCLPRRGQAVGVQVRPVHHKGGRRQRTDGQCVVGTRKLNLKDTLVMLAYARAATRFYRQDRSRS